MESEGVPVPATDHDLVLPFTGCLRVREDHLDVLPSRTVRNTIFDVFVERAGETIHEGSPRSDDIGIPGFPLRGWRTSALGFEFLPEFLFLDLSLTSFLRCSESPSTLLCINQPSIGSAESGRREQIHLPWQAMKK